MKNAFLNSQIKSPLKLRNKKVLVMGLGLHGGGVGTVKFLAKSGAKITITDLRPANVLKPSLKELKKFKGIRYVLDRHRAADFLKADLIVKNPGVTPASPFLKLAKKHSVPLTSDIGVFFKLCPARIIGVTGTRGKSTTAYLIHKFLKTKYSRVFLGGNIRKSVLEFLPHLKRGDWVILELSSFQLQDLAEAKVSPQIAVLTNIYRDHLNWHRSFNDYLKAKSFIFKFQKPRDVVFANPSDTRVRALAKKAPSRKVFPRLAKDLQKIVAKNIGLYYSPSVALAVAVSKHFGIKQKTIKNILTSFRGLEYRQENLGIVRGVHFINDTTSTMPDAAIAALERFRALAPRPARLILIAGGADKNLDFKNLSRTIKKSADILILLPGTATDKIKKLLKNSDIETHNAKSMRDAITKAYTKAKKGDWVILSPGAASFGLFLNEFDRGEKFVKEFKRLKNQ